jgi:hypothetical protein
MTGEFTAEQLAFLDTFIRKLIRKMDEEGLSAIVQELKQIRQHLETGAIAIVEEQK